MPEDLASEFKYDEEWEVHMSNSREPFILNELEYAVLADALSRGLKATLLFDSFSLNTSFIVSTYRKTKRLKKEYQLQAPAPEPEKPLTPEQIENNRKKIAEMRAKLGIRLAVSK